MSKLTLLLHSSSSGRYRVYHLDLRVCKSVKRLDRSRGSGLAKIPKYLQKQT